MGPVRILAACASLVFVTIVATARSVAFAYNHPDSFAQVEIVHAFRRYGFSAFSVGETNYIFKMPLYWAVSHLDLKPHAELLANAIVCNLTGLGLVLTAAYLSANRLIGLTKRRAWLAAWLVALILATNLPHVFLANYPNSRNIELGAGLLAAYLIVRCCWPHVAARGQDHPDRPGAPGRPVLLATAALVVGLTYSDPLLLVTLLAPAYAVCLAASLVAVRGGPAAALTGGGAARRVALAWPRRDHAMAILVVGTSLLLGFVSQDVVAWVLPNAVHVAQIDPHAPQPLATEVGELNRSFRYGLNIDFGRLDPRYGQRDNGFETDYVNLGLLAVAGLSLVRLLLRQGLRPVRYLAVAAVPVAVNVAALTLVSTDQANLSRYLIVSTTIIWGTAVIVVILAHRPPSRLADVTVAAALAVAVTAGVLNLRALATRPWYQLDRDVEETADILRADGIDAVWTSWDRSIRLSYLSDGRILTGVPDCSTGLPQPLPAVNLHADSQQAATAATGTPFVLLGPAGPGEACSPVRYDPAFTFVTTTPMGDVYRRQ